MKTLLSIIISAALVVSGYTQTRNVLVGTNNAVIQPTNFWSADASNARTGLGLGTAATNPASAFQPSSTVLSNLAAGNGTDLTNITATIVGTNVSISNVSGLQAALDGKVSTNGSAAGLTNFPATVLQSTSSVTNFPAGILRTNGDASSLTNFPTVALASNLSTTLAINRGGTAATNASDARINLGATTVGSAIFTATNATDGRTALGATTIGGSVFTLANPSAITFLRLNADNTASALSAADFRTALSLGTAALSNIAAFQPASSALTNLASSNGGALTNLQASNIIGTIAISNGGSGAATAGGARTNFGLGATWLTNTVASNFRTAIGATTIGNALFTATSSSEAVDAIGISTNFGDQILSVSNIQINSFEASSQGFVVPTAGKTLVVRGTNVSSGTPAFFGWDGFIGSAFSAAQARTNIGLSFAALTNTNVTGFNASLYGSNTNPVLVNVNGEVVSPTNFWQAAPISTTVQYQTNVTGTSTNAATNSRNLFLFSLAPSVSGLTNTVTLPTSTATTFEGDRATIIHLATNSANTVTAIRQLGAATNLITLNQVDEAVLLMYRSGAWVLSDNISYIEPIFFSGTNAAANAAASRTNLGLGNGSSPEFASLLLSDLANTNSVDYAVFVDDTGSFYSTSVGAARTNLGLGATNDVTFSNVTASGTLTATSTVTAKTNLVVEGFVNYTAARTNNTPTNIPNFAAHAAWIEVKVGTNSFFLPAYQ